MASSGVYTLDKSALDIIKKALLLCKAYDPNQSLAAEDRETCLDSLNYMIKSWDAAGYHLWTLEDAVLFLSRGTKKYQVGTTGDHICKSDDFIYSQLSVAGVALDESITVDDSTGMSGAADIFTSNQAADVNAWTATNSTLAVASSKLTITNSGASAGYAELALTGLTVGNEYRFTYGYEIGTSTSATFSIISNATSIATATKSATGTYTLDFTATQTTATFRAANVSTTITETTKVTAANYVDQATGDFCGVLMDDGTIEWLNIVSITGNVLYLNGAITTAAAIDSYVYTYSEKIQRPLRIFSARTQQDMLQDEVPVTIVSRNDYLSNPDKTNQGDILQVYYQPKLGNGEMNVWSTSNRNNSILRFSYNNPLEIFDDNANTPNFPAEWYLACAYQLASIIAPEYKADASIQMLEMKAQTYLQDVLGFDQESVSMLMQPDFN